MIEVQTCSVPGLFVGPPLQDGRGKCSGVVID
jgi:hypothetical protein